ncbi:MAG: dTDP-4-amino-4,6-dideoxygalactose transaminase [Alphaproteobacteria bacterium]|nr:dTDP-4-amino-4,6-dideoxygalactose transaminase [Alphaproteobacteria bacterium]
MIKFNNPVFTEHSEKYVADAFAQKHVSGDGKYTKLCHEYMKNKLGCHEALLVHSGTAALEIAAILADLHEGDEVIMPSYTFCSTANAFVLQGAVPVFVDIRADTLNLDENKIEAAITSKTKAIVPVHYAGVACEMDAIKAIAAKHNLLVIEDAAQAYDAFYKGKSLGTLGDMGCFSFHETKNIMAGEGGLFVTNNAKLAERAEIVREKGTNRSKFFRGQVDKYTWVDKGSSYLPSDIVAAYLYSILEIADNIQAKRRKIWQRYYEAFAGAETAEKIRRPIIPAECSNNAHMFYLLFNNLPTRTAFISYLKKYDVAAPFHYIPLHSAPAGKKFCRTPYEMPITDRVSETLVRLPLYYDLSEQEQNRVIDICMEFMEKL